MLINLYSCDIEKEKIVTFEDIGMKIPANWRLMQGNGIDSGVWHIITNNNDTIFIDYGKYSNPFNEIVEVRSFTRKKQYDSLNFAYPQNMVFSETPEIDEAQGLYLNEFFYYDTICGKKAKFGVPKIPKKGRCLLHISNMDKYGNKLSLYAKNLDEDTQKMVLKSFQSLTIKPSI